MCMHDMTKGKFQPFMGCEPVERCCRCLQRTWVIQLHTTLAGALLREPIAMVAGLSHLITRLCRKKENVEYKEVENMETDIEKKQREKGQYEEREGGGKEEEIKLKSLEERKARGMQIEAGIIMRESWGSMCWCWGSKIWMNKEKSGCGLKADAWLAAEKSLGDRRLQKSKRV